MRLDAELLARTPSYLNPLHDREIDLRGHKIPAIENLGVTRDELSSIDLTDNSISSLSNFPLLKRLNHLLLNNNPIRVISPSIATSLPNLRSLTLSNSAMSIASLPSTAIALAKCTKLTALVFNPSPITQADYYKEWLVYNCKHLRSLDFARITEQDRTTSRALFETPEGTPSALANKFTAAASASSTSNGASFAKSLTDNTFEPGSAEVVGGKAGRLLTKEEKERVRKAIEGASSVEEIRRLTRMLGQGFLPTDKDLKDLEKKKVAEVVV